MCSHPSEVCLLEEQFATNSLFSKRESFNRSAMIFPKGNLPWKEFSFEQSPVAGPEYNAFKIKYVDAFNAKPRGIVYCLDKSNSPT